MNNDEIPTGWPTRPKPAGPITPEVAAAWSEEHASTPLRPGWWRPTS